MSHRPRGRRAPLLEVISKVPTEADWQDAETRRILDRHVVAVGTVQNAETGHYHAWISLYGTDLSTIGVYEHEEQAKAMAEANEALMKRWQGTPADLRELNYLMVRGVAESCVPPPAMVLPDSQVREILALIAAQQERKN